MVARDAVEISTGKPEAVRLELAVQFVEHDARLDHAAAAGGVDLDQAVEIFRAVDDQREIDRLPALRGAAAARAVTLTPRRAIAIARLTSSIVRGATTPTGTI